MDNSQTLKNWKEARLLIEKYFDLVIEDALIAIKKDSSIKDAVKNILIKLLESQPQNNTIISDADLSLFEVIKHTEEDLSGKSIGEYKLIKKIGQGGMSCVYKAKRKDTEIQKFVALKLLYSVEEELTEQLKKLFTQEQLTLSKLHHSNIISFYHGGLSQNGIPYLVMEYIDEAQTIRKFVKTNNFSTNAIVILIQQVASALEYAHQNHIIHKDIKPSNILIDQIGTPKVVDFGIASFTTKFTDTGLDFDNIFTPDYASPEQIKNQKLTSCSDIFSLCAVFLELLSDKKPLPKIDTSNYKPKEDTIHIKKLLNQCDINTDLKNIILRGMDLESQNRYQSMGDLIEDLNNWKNLKPVSATPFSKLYKFKLWIKRNKYVALLISILLVTALLFINYRYQSIKQQRLAEKHLILVNDIKSNLRRTHMLPIHNVQEIYAKTIRKIETLQANISKNETHSNGLSEYAIGSAYLSMRAFDKAYIYLQKSIKKGWESPELFSDLGFVLATFWENSIMESYSISDKIKRNEFLNQNKLKYLEPAKKYLTRASKGLATHNYVSAYLAELNENYDKAIKYALEETKINPWFYEAQTYLSFLYIEKAIPIINKTGYKAAKPYIDLSKLYMQQSINIGSSDPHVYKEHCANFGFNIQVELQYDTINIDKTFNNGVKTCQQAIELSNNIDTLSIYINLVKLYMQYADYHVSQGTNHIEYIQKANDISNQGLMLFPNDSHLLSISTQPLLELAKEALRKDKEPTNFYQKAKNRIKKSIEINPNKRSSWFRLGVLQKEIANYYRSINNFSDADINYEDSIKTYDKVKELGNEFGSLANKAITQYDYAKSKKIQGQAQKSIELFRNSVENSEKIFKFNTESYVIYANYFEFQFELVKALKENNLNYVNELNHAIKTINNSCKLNYINKSHIKQIQTSMDYFIKKSLASFTDFRLCNQRITSLNSTNISESL